MASPANQPKARRLVAAGALVFLALMGTRTAARATESPIVVTAAAERYATILTERLRANLPEPPPLIVTDTAREAIARFCAPGDTNDTAGLATHRRLNRREHQACVNAGIEPIELTLGIEAAVVVVPTASRIGRISTDALFGAVIRDMPVDGRIHPNAARQWRAVDAALPDETISVLLPAAPQAARMVFDERGLQSACRKLPAMQAIYAAAERSRRCTALRNDPNVTEYDEPAAVAAAIAANAPGTVAVVSYGSFRKLSGRVLALPLDGTAADDTTIGNETYPLSRRVYLYLRAPGPRYEGAAARHRLALIADAASHEGAVGPGGAFEDAGLVPPPMAERANQRLAAMKRLAGERP